MNETPLHIACNQGYLSIVQYLIEKGANIEAKDKYQQTPLHIACQNNNLPVVQYLIEKGANIEAQDYQKRTLIHGFSMKENKNAKDKNGHTPNEYASNSDINKIFI